MADPLANLPRLGVEALGPCLFCKQPILRTPVPIFYRVTVQYCGVDHAAITQHVGLSMMLGGGAAALAIADVMGAHQPPAVVMDRGTVNVCVACAQDRPDLYGTLHAAFGDA